MGHLGHADYNKWKQGKRLTRQHQIYANCYECNGLSDSGPDCGGEKTCPLYIYSPSAKRRGVEGTYVLSTNKKKRTFK